jgi:Secretion system C-terminal sorting domain
MKHKMTMLSGIFLLGFGYNGLYAQDGTVASGGDALSNDGSVSYSIGQVFYLANNGSGGSVEQGLQHAYEISSLALNENSEIALNLEVYPNPTTDHLTLNVKDTHSVGLSYILYDTKGKVISSNNVSDNKTIIEMSDLGPSSYFLQVSDNNDNIVRTFKIIKNQ